MSERIRFAAAQQVFEAFPRVTNEIGLRPADETPLDFARKLLARAQGFEAIVYIACVLPRREAVWWGCQCVRALGGAKDGDGLLAAEAWVRDPEEAQRRAALEIGSASDLRPTTWLASAAGHSGGSITPEGAYPVAAPVDATAIKLKAAVILALTHRPIPDVKAWVQACVEAGIRFAEGGDAKVIAPTLAAAKVGAA